MKGIYREAIDSFCSANVGRTKVSVGLWLMKKVCVRPRVSAVNKEIISPQSCIFWPDACLPCAALKAKKGHLMPDVHIVYQSTYST
jgi:hypothetical protein